MDTKRKYYEAKADYHNAGNAIRGKNKDDEQRKKYLDAKKKYHEIGEALKKENKK